MFHNSNGNQELTIVAEEREDSKRLVGRPRGRTKACESRFTLNGELGRLLSSPLSRLEKFFVRLPIGVRFQ